ncbi:Cytochrome P450 [Penicillium fimorum]|uniref:Cytochrome P450 n=1 Tax=Penicillium fimorum TaxID=1882269 RepID=A0A9W9XTR3_9EURO|nr:Cytochrome P450 [Penicillium fimorum]
MPIYVSIIGTLVLVYLSVFAYRLLHNIKAARRIGLPFLVYPISQNNIIWVLTSVPLRPWLRRTLPTRIWNRLTLVIYGWEFHEKRRPFDEYAAPQGDDRSFLLAGCGTLELWTADPVIASEVLQRTSDFKVPTITGLLLAQFGHNVFTTNGARWAKQRKVIASVINERISKTVFDATICQTTGMLDELLLTASEKERGFAESNVLFDMIKRGHNSCASRGRYGHKGCMESRFRETRARVHNDIY